MAVKKTNRKLPMNREKMCNICGELCLVYSVDRNGIICNDCKPLKKNKIPSQSQMLSLILNKKEDDNHNTIQNAISE